MGVTKTGVRNFLVLVIAACALLALLIATGLVTSPFKKSHVRRIHVWLKNNSPLSQGEYTLDEDCTCMWQIGCMKFKWQTNFTSPIYRCANEIMTDSLIDECLAERLTYHGRGLRVYIAGHIREAFLVEYAQQRLRARQLTQTCRLTKAPPEKKNFNAPADEDIPYYDLATPAGRESCESSYARDGMTLSFKYIDILGPETFSFVESLMTGCRAEGCAGDILIFSGGMGELLNSTLLNSFTGVRRFQKQYKRLLPMLIDLVTTHKMEVVWKIHEPVTDELIAEDSMIRNDLLQEYNALIMEETMSTPVRVWTSHMIMKLHHIEECDSQANSTQPNRDEWRCEEELVPGDALQAEYFDTIFNKACDKFVSMPDNPCCSA